MYRDEYERCPRDGTELVDAGDVRACSQCHGQWLSQATLVEMARTMTSPREPTIMFHPDSRTPISCPTCANAMQTWTYNHYVTLDRCERHGIWFDGARGGTKGELETVLYAVFEDDRHPPKTDDV